MKAKHFKQTNITCLTALYIALSLAIACCLIYLLALVLSDKPTTLQQTYKTNIETYQPLETYKQNVLTATYKPPVLPSTSRTYDLATYYGDYFHGRLTASGEVYDEWGLTAAHNSLSFGTMVEVTNIENGKKVIVKITDRGGFTHALDLSKGAFQELAPLAQGVIKISYKILDK